MQNWQALRDGAMDHRVFHQRDQLLMTVRGWFHDQDFLEMETPLMVRHPGMEPHLNLFSSEYVPERGGDREPRYLHTSPEYAMKKLLGAGFERIFQLTKVFRNGEVGRSHNPEFTMLEWYRAQADYRDIMSDTEDMVRALSSVMEISSGVKALLDQEWERLSVLEAFQRYAAVDLNACREWDELRAVAIEKGYELRTDYDWDDLFFLIMLNEVEPHLGYERPVFLYDYPASQAALAKKRERDPFWAERFELYIKGVELCNAFSELVDPVEQRQRLEEEQALRKQLGKEAYAIDEAFLEALETMPPSGGNALGIDRLLMVFLEKERIDDVLCFPWKDA